MATGDERDDGGGSGGPLPMPPGLTTASLGPFGVPVPVPEMETTDIDDGAPGDDGAPDPAGDVPDNDDSEGVERLRETADVGEAYIDRVEEAMGDEACAFCKGILQQLRGRPMDEQVQGVRELATLKEEMQSDPDEDRIRELLDGFEAIDVESQFV